MTFLDPRRVDPDNRERVRHFLRRQYATETDSAMRATIESCFDGAVPPPPPMPSGCLAAIVMAPFHLLAAALGW